MSASALSDISFIDPSQNGKAATANTAFVAIDGQLNGSLTLAANSLANPYTIPYSVTDEPAGTKTALRFVYAKVTGAIGSNWTAYMPAGKQRLFVVENATTGGHNVIFMVSGQTGVSIPPGAAFLCFLNGTDVVQPPLQPVAGSYPWEVGNFVDGMPTNGTVVMRFIVARTITFPPDFSSNQMKAGTGAAATAVWNVNKNGSLVGTATFAPSGTVPTWATVGHIPVVYNSGDVGTFIAPSPQDGSLADLEWIFAGTR